MNVYADHAATTKISPAALAAMVRAAEECYGNPSSLHCQGQRASAVLEEAREKIAFSLGVEPREIYFTSGGSEGDTQAILSMAENGRKKGKHHIVTSAFEHHAVLNTIKQLSKKGFSVTYLSPHTDGIIRPQELEAVICDDTALVSVMSVNNEIGTIQPIRTLSEICHTHGVPFHTDAVQAIGHIPLNLNESGIDLLTASAHKFRGPRGVGFLYVHKGFPLHSLIYGGGQERGKRAGTENVPGIVGMAEALSEAIQNLEASKRDTEQLREQLIQGLLKIPRCCLNGARDHLAPGIVNFCFEGAESESLLLMLDAAGVCASAGSACSAGALEPSHVLLAMDCPRSLAQCSLRISLSHLNSSEEVEYIIQTITQTVAQLRETNPHWNRCQSGQEQFLLH